jgi:hypothetical protein
MAIKIKISVMVLLLAIGLAQAKNLLLIVGQESEDSPDILIFYPDLDYNGKAYIKATSNRSYVINGS